LLLDEATSALDSDNEKEVQRAINSLPEDMTVIAIAHRISTIIHADKVVVMDNGRVQAVGTHTELLKSSELYRRLAQSYVETDFTGSPGDEEAEQRNSVTPLMED
jgi:ABC-type multidrug transport system fused ATPase/permease subunit